VKIRIVLEIVFIFIVAGMGFRLGFVEGHNEANFDRETATRQLNSCYEVIVHNKSSEG